MFVVLFSYRGKFEDVFFSNERFFQKKDEGEGVEVLIVGGNRERNFSRED